MSRRYLAVMAIYLMYTTGTSQHVLHANSTPLEQELASLRCTTGSSAAF